MPSVHLLLVVATGLLFTLHFAISDDVLCYEAVNEKTGECEDYIGEGVPKDDCCLNINYGFRREAHGQCQSCRPAKWTAWSSWSPCSVSCKEGVQERRRTCNGQGNCPGKNIEVQACMLQECCPVQGGWSTWSLWSQCSVTCRIGQKERTRKCDNPRPSCGGRCTGPEKEVDTCYTNIPCPIHGQWGKWGSWQECSSSCKTESGILPIQTRLRLCNDPVPSHSPPGNKCDGKATNVQTCDNLPFCAVDGQWGAWRRDSECSVTCAVGRVQEKRSCDNPPPRYGGRYCEGSDARKGICNTKVACPVDGQWSEWGDWSKCSRLTNEFIRCKPKVGSQYRKRKCNGASPDGKWCEGDYRESRSCYDIDKCNLKGTWSEWSSWGLCSSHCGQAERTRHRECLGVYPDYPNIVQGSLKTVEVFFSGTPKLSCNPINEETKRVEEREEAYSMAPQTLLLLVTVGTLVIFQATADDVLCYAEVNEVTGECEDYLGEGVPDLDCCLNIKYAFKRDPSSSCQGCRPAEWSQWSDWSPCTVSCTEGVQQRKRVCIGQGDCEGNDLEVRVCSLQDCCPQSGGWSQWSLWSACSVTCEKGQRKRTRQCNSPAPACGGICRGNDEEVEKCDTFQVCPTHGQWGEWGDWRQCSSNCMVEGSGIFPTQPRYRHCNNPPPSTFPPGNPCPGSDQDFRDCTALPFCPVDGQWGPWQKDSECSVTCGVGRVEQKRSCDSPAPKYGGNFCVGSSTRHRICNTKVACPIDGAWSNWEEWSECKRLNNELVRCKSRAALQHRKRQCDGTQHGGKWCEGESRESRSCYNAQGCLYPTKGTWTEWSEWGLCSSPCGQSVRKRFRECLPNYPDYPMVVDGATKTVDVFFWGTPRFSCVELNKETLRLEETEPCKNTLPCS
ncbi:properdin [Mantella aurantiaca]